MLVIVDGSSSRISFVTRRSIVDCAHTTLLSRKSLSQVGYIQIVSRRYSFFLNFFFFFKSYYGETAKCGEQEQVLRKKKQSARGRVKLRMKYGTNDGGKKRARSLSLAVSLVGNASYSKAPPRMSVTLPCVPPNCIRVSRTCRDKNPEESLFTRGPV